MIFYLTSLSKTAAFVIVVPGITMVSHCGITVVYAYMVLQFNTGSFFFREVFDYAVCMFLRAQ